MSQRNSPENKAKRRALKRVKKAQNRAPFTHKTMWVNTKDKYGNNKKAKVTMPVRSV